MSIDEICPGLFGAALLPCFRYWRMAMSYRLTPSEVKRNLGVAIGVLQRLFAS